MKASQLIFVGRRVCDSLWELIWTHALTSGTMAMSLFVFGSFLLVQENFQNLLRGWGDKVQIHAYLEKGLETESIRQVLDLLQGYPEVEQVRHISQEQAWRDFRSALGSQSSVLEGLPRDVLPASFEIYLKQAYRDGPLVEELASRLRKVKGIASVEYPQEWVERLSLVMLAVEWAKWILGGMLFVATFLIVGSTVKLAMIARKDEIEIMQLVGASEELIQAPFVLEGMIQGIAGGCFSLICLWSLYSFLRQQIPSSVGLLGPFELQFLDPVSIVLLITIGWLLGAAGSLFSLRRFLRT